MWRIEAKAACGPTDTTPAYEAGDAGSIPAGRTHVKAPHTAVDDMPTEDNSNR